MNARIVLSLCDRTGNMARPWIDAGYTAITVDMQDAQPEQGRIHFVADIRRWHYPLRYGVPAIVFAAPPCTDMAGSGARWMRDKGLGALADSLAIVNACREICESCDAPWMLENPVGTLATYWRDPDFEFDPCDYGDPYTKKTYIWAGGGFVMPEKIMPGDMFAEPTFVEPTKGSMMHMLPGSTKNRGDVRSATPPGFCHAVFRANALCAVR